MSDNLEDNILHEINALYPIDPQVLSAREQKILDLYSEQEEIRLETALLNAQNNCT